MINKCNQMKIYNKYIVLNLKSLNLRELKILKKVKAYNQLLM